MPELPVNAGSLSGESEDSPVLESGGEPRPVRLSVVTVAWNGRDLIRNHLGAIERCREMLRFGIEVVLVDNDSSDGTPEMVEREFPWVALIRNDTNLGFAMGCRQGLERARGDFLLLLNPDCEATPFSLVSMMDFLHRFPNAGAVGCRLLHADGTPQRSAYRDHTPWRYILYHSAASPALYSAKKVVRGTLRAVGFPCERWESRKKPRPCDWLMGACIMVRRRVYEETGSLDPAYFMYSEDADWCRRIRAAGYGVYYLPEPAMLHRQKQSSHRSREFTYVRLYRSLLMLCLRHMPPDSVLAMRRVVLADMALRRWIFPVLTILKPADASIQRQRRTATRRVAEIWRRMDPEFDPDPPPTAPGDEAKRTGN